MCQSSGTKSEYTSPIEDENPEPENTMNTFQIFGRIGSFDEWTQVNSFDTVEEAKRWFYMNHSKFIEYFQWKIEGNNISMFMGS